jgi:predicted TIM-barrel fold metal-dependent hydrolase
MYDPVAINNREVTGIETLMWGNDYPHPEGTWPESQKVNADQFEGVGESDVTAIVSGNAARVFGFDLDQLAKISPPVPA